MNAQYPGMQDRQQGNRFNEQASADVQQAQPGQASPSGEVQDSTFVPGRTDVPTQQTTMAGRQGVVAAPADNQGGLAAQQYQAEGVNQPYKDQPQERFPEVLNQHPTLDDEQKDLLARHQASGHRLAPHTVEPLREYYDFLAKHDPSSATFNPSAHTVVPMPRGGLDTIVRQHLGARPTQYAIDDDSVSAADRREIVNKQLEYDENYRTYKHLLFRMNTDTLRTDDQYILGAPVRVFTEGL